VNGQPFCQGGTCGFSCPAPETPCLENCADLSSDIYNCNSCRRVCPTPPNSNPTCSSGNCGFQCQFPFSDCDGNPFNGCEVNYLIDPSNCGGCGKLCPFGPNSVASCNAGTCAITCSSPFSNCDGNPSNGCEVNIGNDTHNCGACGNACPSDIPNASANCVNSMCSIQCAPGYSNCDGNLANGCETLTASDPQNCGTCGNVCPTGINGFTSCTSSACTITCNTGFANCDSNILNGCEVDLKTDILNCGSCGNVCPSSNGTPTCSNGNCAITCNTGFGNCDGNVTNGCETNLTNDPNNCGSCGHSVSISSSLLSPLHHAPFL